jgi:hypothetical protein
MVERQMSASGEEVVPQRLVQPQDTALQLAPEITGYLTGLHQAQHFVAANRGLFDRAPRKRS